jgi:hypothetical protein
VRPRDEVQDLLDPRPIQLLAREQRGGYGPHRGPHDAERRAGARVEALYVGANGRLVRVEGGAQHLVHGAISVGSFEAIEGVHEARIQVRDDPEPHLDVEAARAPPRE